MIGPLRGPKALQRYLEGYTQNVKENYLNSVIWSMSQNVYYCGAKIIEIASHTASSVFNDGYTSVLYIMKLLKHEIGPSALKFAEKLDSQLKLID